MRPASPSARRSAAKPLVIEPDPLVSISDTDRRFWHDSQVAASQLLGTARAALESADMLDTVVSSAELALEANTGAAQSAGEEVERVRGEVDGVTEALSEIAGQLGRAYSGMRGSTSVPTDDQIGAAERAYEQLGGHLDALNRLVGEELLVLNAALDAAGIPAHDPAPVSRRKRSMSSVIRPAPSGSRIAQPRLAPLPYPSIY